MVQNNNNHLEHVITHENLPVRFFKSGDYGAFIPFHYHPALELILLTKGKLKIETPDQATSNACMKCAIPSFPFPLPKSISELKQTKLRFSDPMPEYEADLPNQCSLNAQGANLVLINSNELHNSTCTSYNEAYVLQIPESFLKEELNYNLDLPMRFDLKRASLQCLEQMSQYLLELAVAHEYCQGQLGFKVHFNHGLYGILSCLMDMIIPKPISAHEHSAHIALGSTLQNKCLAQQYAQSLHADSLLEKEPVNAHPNSTTIMIPSLNEHSFSRNECENVELLTNQVDSLAHNPLNQDELGSSFKNNALINNNNRQSLDVDSNNVLFEHSLSDIKHGPTNHDTQFNDNKPYCFCIDDEEDDYLISPKLDVEQKCDDDKKTVTKALNSDKLEAEAKVALALNKNMNLRRIQPVLDYLKVHYHEQIKLQEMADLINLNPRYFCRVFKDAVGMSLLSYVSELRLCHIYNDLTDTKTLISTIMRRHGYSDHKQFYRSFKARFKVTPKEVRAMIKSSQNPLPPNQSY